jgi:hypothetical protein
VGKPEQSTTSATAPNRSAGDVRRAGRRSSGTAESRLAAASGTL